jgi:hypothetical protein
MRQPLLAEPARLERVVAVRKLRIGRAHGCNQGIDDFRLDAVGKVPRRGDVGEAAPTVGDLLVLGERVGDQGEQPQVFLEGFGQRFGGGLAGALLRVLHQVEGLLDRQRLAGDLEPQADHGLIEQPIERGIAGHRLFLEQLLDTVLELVGLVPADILDPRPVMTERCVRHRLVQYRVVDAIELQREEQQMQVGRGEALLHIAVEFGQHRIGGVAGVEQAGVGAEPAGDVVDLLVALDRGGELGAGVGRRRKPLKIALVRLLEVDALGLDPILVALELQGIDAGVEVSQIPFRQRPQRLGGGLFGGSCGARRRLGRDCGHAVRAGGSKSRVKDRATRADGNARCGKTSRL